MVENVVNHDLFKKDLASVVGNPELAETLFCAMVGRVSAQPTLAHDRNGQAELYAVMYGAQYRMAQRKAAIWVHSAGGNIIKGMVMGNFSISRPDLVGLLETFEKMPRPTTH
jgi:hypothetical protein